MPLHLPLFFLGGVAVGALLMLLFTGSFTKKKKVVDRPHFRNESGLDFKDISSESFRKYLFPNGSTLFIDSPLYLHVSDSGGHRVFDAQGYSFYIKVCEGLFSPESAEGTWVMMINPNNNKPEIQYFEQRVCAFSFKIN